jgi:hypothetical protein
MMKEATKGFAITQDKVKNQPSIGTSRRLLYLKHNSTKRLSWEVVSNVYVMVAISLFTKRYFVSGFWVFCYQFTDPVLFCSIEMNNVKD